MTTLNELLGSYDNLDEAVPWMNEKSSIWGLVISCLVSLCLTSAAMPVKPGRVLHEFKTLTNSRLPRLSASF